MISPSSGVRPLGMSQNSRFVLTPTPRTAGHFISGTAVVGCTGGAAGAGLRVCGTGLRGVVCASIITDAQAKTAAPAAIASLEAGLVIAHAGLAGRYAFAQAGTRTSQLDQLEELHARPRIRSERAEHGAGDGEGILLLDA